MITLLSLEYQPTEMSTYPSECETRAHCSMEGKSAVFYTNPGNKTKAAASAASIGGIVYTDAFPSGFVAKKKRKSANKSGSDSWCSFVAVFSRVFAEEAQGEVYLVSKVPPVYVPGTVWNDIELPSLRNNDKVTSLTCVDVNDFNLRETINLKDQAF